MSKIVFDFAASEGNMCVLVSAQVTTRHKDADNQICLVLSTLNRMSDALM
jgi:hypothetical protein